MSKKTDGITDLVNTLVKQHGLEKSIAIANAQMREIKDERRRAIWHFTRNRLNGIRP